MKKRIETNRIVFHHSLTDSGDVITFREYHMGAHGWEDIGYHFVVPKEGNFQYGRKMQYEGAHAKGKNHDSIGVCLVGNFYNYEPTVSQLEECVRLYHDICRVYNKKLEIDFHREGDNPCPGPLLDREDFKEILYRGGI